jgi:MraZ protein
MFRGEHEHTIDDKGRLMVPIKFRDELGVAVVIGRGTLGQVNVYPKAAFEEMEHKLDAAGDADGLYYASLLLAAANEAEVDKQGRIVIPPVLRRHAKLGVEVIVIGNIDHVEIWNPDIWLETYSDLVQDYRKQRDNLPRLRELGVRM